MKLFAENVLNREIEDSGYTQLSVLSSSDIDSLLKTYKESTVEVFDGFHPTMFHQNLAYRKAMNNCILQILNERLSAIISSSFHLLYGNYMVKEPGSNSKMKLHQDWTYVDENNYRSYAVWIPLLDLNEENGAFSVIPKSHHLNNLIRGPGTSCPLAVCENDLISKFGKSLYLKAGEAVFWDHKLGHYSPPNLSDVPRIAITAIIVPKETPILHYFKEQESNEIAEYLVNETFYMDYNIGQAPSLPKNKILEEKKVTLTMIDFKNLLE